VPDKVRSAFKTSRRRSPGKHFTEILPKLAKVNDKFTMINSMSYTPNGLFNHTAAIYQIMTGYTTDKVSPSGQLEPPNAKDFPNFGSNIIRLKPPDEPMLPFVMLPRPLQESNVVGKGGTAQASSARLTIPTRSSPMATTSTWARWTASRSTTSSSAPISSACAWSAAPSCATPSTPDARHRGRHEGLSLDSYYSQALNLISSGRARDAFALDRESLKNCATATAATPSARAACLPVACSKPAPAWSKSSGPRSPTPTTTPGTTTSASPSA
jgi:hypothetical protein